uniref:Transposase n=1 Tax=Acrobeloides nanus TaxID=290746 RepID=A0A914EPN1_9BILA
VFIHYRIWLNTAKRIWNALPTELVAIVNPERFKSAVKDPAVYTHLINQKAVRNVESAV